MPWRGPVSTIRLTLEWTLGAATPLCATLLVALLVTSAPAAADDRALIDGGSGDAWVFVLLDVGDAMLLDTAGKPLQRGADDPASRLHLAKSALFAALAGEERPHFGFATFPDQDGLYAAALDAEAGSVEVRSEAVEDGCSGWEPNDDAPQDPHRGHSLKRPTRGAADSPLSTGDLLPPDPSDPRREELRRRLAPNLDLGDAVPDFGLASYFTEVPVDGQHRLLDPRAIPLVARGASGIAAALDSFLEWSGAWSEASTVPVAAGGCPRVELLLIVGGGEGCGGSPASAAARLLSARGVHTHVVGVGEERPEWHAIAEAGGTGAAVSASTLAELTAALERLLGGLDGEDGASAPPFATGVLSGAGQVVHTSLRPVAGSGTWSGRVDSYLRPVPLASAGGTPGPDRERLCDAASRYGCRSWDAGEALLAQAPTSDEVEAGIYRQGNGEDQRRIFYAGSDGARRVLLPPLDSLERTHLYGPEGMGLEGEGDELAESGRQVLREALAIRSSDEGPFLLGDSLHSQPVLIEPPARLDYLAADLEGRSEACAPLAGGGPETQVPYGCFARQLRYRRRMLAIGSNDGQLHVFDAGLPALGPGDAVVYGSGSGHELFAFVPRAALAAVARTALGGGHEPSVDGTVTVDDVLIAGPEGAPREWRTLLVGGMREGGSAYYALDVTQPDRLDSNGLPASAGYVPGCVDGGEGCGMPSPFPGLPATAARPFPALLWELTDTEDEDGNGAPDLGRTWSRPATGRIRTTRGDRFVAIFGGGMDADFKRRHAVGEATDGWSGNHLYMVELESGEILYKRPLDRPFGMPRPASVPSGPAAVDGDFDGYLDAIYVGTTAGFLYKVDLTSPGVFGAGGSRITGSGWTPFPIFDTGSRPIYHAPRVLFVSGSGSLALAFGTGDREDLWSASGFEGRFYAMVDEGLTAAAAPLTEAALEAIEVASAPRPAGESLLEGAPETPDAEQRAPGWSLRLEPEERLLGAPVAAAGVLLFNTYTPDRPGSTPVCGGAGVTRSYALVVTNANAVDGERRFAESVGLSAVPQVDVALSAPAALPGGAPDPAAVEGPCTGEVVEEIRKRLEAELHPPGCQAGGRALEVVALDADSERACRVALPICVLLQDWREGQ